MLRYSARALLVAGLGLASTAACHGRKQAPAERREPTVSAAVAARSRAKPQLLHRSSSPAPLEQFVQQHVEEADASGQRVLVYVGAKWCAPCQRFHRALESGQLDESLAGTQFVEFDLDRDRDELRGAGYDPKFIPQFSVPDQSGHASGRAIEGAVEGGGTLRETLVPRLLALLDGQPVD
jgi:thiol-disulfide isomerase/thioredoxin